MCRYLKCFDLNFFVIVKYNIIIMYLLGTICLNNNVFCVIQVIYIIITAGNLFAYSPSTKRFARRRVGNRLNLHGSSRTGRAADTNPNYSDITSETVSLFKPYNFLFVLYAADARRRCRKKKIISKIQNIQTISADDRLDTIYTWQVHIIIYIYIYI